MWCARRYLDEQSRVDKEKFQKFFNEFGVFLKEGVCSDHKFQVCPPAHVTSCRRTTFALALILL